MHDLSRRGLAIGVFDGVHLGHRAILDGAAEALTFRLHPLKLLAPARAPKLLMDFDARLEAIRATGIGAVTVLDFTPEFAALSPDDFASRYLAGKGPIRCGANWRFGAGGAGDADWLRAHNYEVEVVSAARWRDESVSSTRIRAALAEGRLSDAAAMLNRPWVFRGRVFAGKGEGRRLGYPTVNLAPCEEPPLAQGVYIVTVAGVRALANWGVAPTFGERAWPTGILELYFPDGVVPALEGVISVVPDAFLRPERRFPDTDSLRAAIAADLVRFTQA